MKNKNTYTKGKIGEYFTILIYLFMGFRVIKIRYQSRLGEIDLIFRRGNLIVFCEVKTRINLEKNYDITNIVSEFQKNRIINSANNFIAKSYRYRNFQYRFDLVIVKSFFKLPIIYKNTWM